MKFRKWARTEGIKGEIKNPEDFVVREIIEKKFLKKFSRTERGVQKTKGPYTLFMMKKRNMNTIDAIKIVARELGAHENDIGFAGLKDKNAVIYQYITIKSDKLKKENLGTGIVKNIEKCVEIKKMGFTDKKISVGDLICNEFEITLHNCRNLKNIASIIDEIMERGIPNYFGPQRFGKNKNNHIIGKHLVKKEFNEALKIINKNQKARLSDIKNIQKSLVKFFINAYQSWIFNKTIENYIEKNADAYFSDIRVFGYNTKLGNNTFDRILEEIIRKEDITQKDFLINELRVRCDGGSRKSFIKLRGISYKIKGKTVTLRFVLPKGSYATTLLNEMMS